MTLACYLGMLNWSFVTLVCYLVKFTCSLVTLTSSHVTLACYVMTLTWYIVTLACYLVTLACDIVTLACYLVLFTWPIVTLTYWISSDIGVLYCHIYWSRDIGMGRVMSLVYGCQGETAILVTNFQMLYTVYCEDQTKMLFFDAGCNR